MGKTKKELMSKAPWRGDDGEEENMFKDAKLSATNQPGSTPVMHVPGKNKKKPVDDGEDDLEIDPELRYSFQRNLQVVVWTRDKDIIAAMNDIHVESKFLQRVFSIDTIVKPLPPAMAYNASRNLNFFTRIFTQFFDPEGIANAQKTLGLGQEERERRVRD